MPLTAIHPLAGRLDATMPLLGVDLEWEQVHRVSPPVALVCRGCGAPMSAKASSRGLRFFAHRSAAPGCPSQGETIAHRLLKIELVTAARDAGWHAELEIAGNGWRADVLATSPDGTRRIAFEAQLASSTIDDLTERTATMRADAVEVCWVTDHDVPWVTNVPSVRITRLDAPHSDTADQGRSRLDVLEGHGRFVPHWCSSRTRCEYSRWARAQPCEGHGSWEVPPPMPLPAFVAAVCARTLAVHTARGYIARITSRHDAGRLIWTARRYFELEAEQVAAREALERDRRRQAAKDDEHFARIEALLDRQRRLIKPAVAFVYNEAAAWPRVDDHGRDPKWAMGVPMFVRDEPYAVICPVASRIDERISRMFAQLLLIVADEAERARIAAQCHPEQRFVVLAAEQ